MMWGNSKEHWGLVSQLLHWLVALLVVGLLVIGFVMANFTNDIATKFRLIQWHKSFGILVLALMIVRLVWRRTAGHTPALPDTLKPWERALAHLTHYGLYALLLMMPVIGWLAVSSSTRGIPTEIFGLFTLPKLTGPDKAVHVFFEGLHEIVAYGIIALVLLHAGAALKHHYILKDNILRRMVPGAKGKP